MGIWDELKAKVNEKACTFVKSGKFISAGRPDGT